MLSTKTMDMAACEVLRQNDRWTYTVPTDGLYPHQWNWDSAFAAFGFAQFDIDKAWTELDILFSDQWVNGMVPHILLHTVDQHDFPGPDIGGCYGLVPSSWVSQPPNAGRV